MCSGRSTSLVSEALAYEGSISFFGLLPHMLICKVIAGRNDFHLKHSRQLWPSGWVEALYGIYMEVEGYLPPPPCVHWMTVRPGTFL